MNSEVNPNGSKTNESIEENIELTNTSNIEKTEPDETQNSKLKLKGPITIPIQFSAFNF